MQFGNNSYFCKRIQIRKKMLHKQTNQYVAACALLFVNLLFACKYSVRISVEFGILFTALYAIVWTILFYLLQKHTLKTVVIHCIFFSYILLLCMGLMYVDKLSLNVDAINERRCSLIFRNLLQVAKSRGIDLTSMKPLKQMVSKT